MTNHFTIVTDFKNFNANVPKIVYKYRTWKDVNHKNLLKRRQLFLASPKSFDDYMDCNLEEVFPEGEKLYEYFVNKLKRDFPSKNTLELMESANNLYLNSPLANKETRGIALKQLKNEHDNKFGVLSLSLRFDNNYMWENYGDNHHGYCIGFDTKKLVKNLDWGGGGHVNYCESLPPLDFNNDTFDDYFSKSYFHKRHNPYYKEEEYRIIKTWGHNVSVKERILYFSTDSAVQIITGKDISSENETKIRQIQQNMFPNASLIKL